MDVKKCTPTCHNHLFCASLKAYSANLKEESSRIIHNNVDDNTFPNQDKTVVFTMYLSDTDEKILLSFPGINFSNLIGNEEAYQRIHSDWWESKIFASQEYERSS
jgi:hypothetical protein